MHLPTFERVLAAVLTQGGLVYAQALAHGSHAADWAVVAIACLQALVGIVFALGAKEAAMILDEAEDIVRAWKGGPKDSPPPVPPEVPHDLG